MNPLLCMASSRMLQPAAKRAARGIGISKPRTALEIGAVTGSAAVVQCTGH